MLLNRFIQVLNFLVLALHCRLNLHDLLVQLDLLSEDLTNPVGYLAIDIGLKLIVFLLFFRQLIHRLVISIVQLAQFSLSLVQNL